MAEIKKKRRVKKQKKKNPTRIARSLHLFQARSFKMKNNLYVLLPFLGRRNWGRERTQEDIRPSHINTDISHRAL